VTTLRGARVEVDSRRVARVLGVAVAVAVFALAVALVVVGANKNAQISALRSHGVRVEVTVSSCLGLLGGSGSNQAGYACRGTFRFAGRSYDEAIPGDTDYAPGAQLIVVAASTDPALIGLPSVVAHERTSLSVYVVPAVLLVVLLAWGVVIGRRRGRARSPS
jgi:hypothetical protein